MTVYAFQAAELATRRYGVLNCLDFGDCVVDGFHDGGRGFAYKSLSELKQAEKDNVKVFEALGREVIVVDEQGLLDFARACGTFMKVKKGACFCVVRGFRSFCPLMMQYSCFTAGLL
jgi:hypothetical protein